MSHPPVCCEIPTRAPVSDFDADQPISGESWSTEAAYCSKIRLPKPIEYYDEYQYKVIYSYQSDVIQYINQYKEANAQKTSAPI